MRGSRSAITWRPGGLRAASDGPEWIPAEGRTGYLNGNRVVEEPNPFGRLIRSLFKKKLVLQVDEEETLLETPDEVYDAIISKFFKEKRYSIRNNMIRVSIKLFVIDKSGEHPSSCGWIVLIPDGDPGRMTPREPWIANSMIWFDQDQILPDPLDIS